MTPPFEQRLALAQEVSSRHQAATAGAVGPWPREQLLQVCAELAPTGYLGSTLSPEHGGHGLTPRQFAQLVEAISPSLPFLGNHSLPRYLASAGDARQQQEWIPTLLAGTAIGAIAITEPSAGADVRSIATTATRSDRGWTLRGHKTWVTHGAVADVIVVTARTDHGLARFLVRPDLPGVAIEGMDPIGLDYLHFDDVYLDDVVVSHDDLLGRVGGGLQDTLAAFPIARSLVAVQASAITNTAIETAIQELDMIERFGARLTEKQATQLGVSQSWARCQAARALAYDSLDAIDRNPDMARRLSSAAKALATETAVEVCGTLLSLLGADGLTSRHAITRRLSDAQMLAVADGPAAINWLVLGRDLTGRTAF